MSIYLRRGCDTNGPDGTCSRCGKKEACGVWWFKIKWQGRVIRQSTKVGNAKAARLIEAKYKVDLAKGEADLNKNVSPTLSQFLKDDFLKWETTHAKKPATLRYYMQGADMLKQSAMASLPIDKITDQHAREFEVKYAALSPSGINRGLRTLRCALNRALAWGKMKHPIKIALANGERQRDRVLTESEQTAYLGACPQPWKDCATIILDEGFRPGEVFTLRWSHLFFNDDGTGLIQIVEGKSKAAKRILPMTPRVYALLLARYDAAGNPEDGWVFASGSKCGHITQDTTKDQHKKALEDSTIEIFVPYTLRHTALTRLGKAAGDNPYALAAIAGHSSITITYRYVHTQAEAISRVFAASLKASRTKGGTQGGTQSRTTKKKALPAVGQKALKSA